MSRTNQVRPIATIATPFYQENTVEASSSIDDETANEYLKILRRYVSRKFCYHADAANEAKISKINIRVAFQVDIWTLMEKRQVKSTSGPYKDEKTPGETVGDLFDAEKYNLKADTTVVKGKQSGHIILSETQKKVSCTACRGEGIRTCNKCNGIGYIHAKPCSKCDRSGKLNCSKCLNSGFILQRSELHCNRYTVHSVTYPKDTFLPDKCIRNSNGKTQFFEDDILYENESLWSNFETLEDCITENSPYDFRNAVEKQFKDKHLSKVGKSTRIRRIKCSIQRVDVVDIGYQAEYYINKTNKQKGPHTFTFLLYGRDIKNNPEIYENDYPLNTCGCLGHRCACRSICCSIL